MITEPQHPNAQSLMFLYRDEFKPLPAEKEHDSLRHIISINLQQLILFYKEIKDERKRLYDTEYEIEGYVFSAFFEIEMFFELVEGYAHSISQYGKVKNRDSAIEELGHCNIFKNKVFSEWLSSHAGEYPSIFTYIALVNYLRIQLIEYLRK
jgi:hypothetical protein